jgi:hypothetical protein
VKTEAVDSTFFAFFEAIYDKSKQYIVQLQLLLLVLGSIRKRRFPTWFAAIMNCGRRFTSAMLSSVCSTVSPMLFQEIIL